MRRGDGDLVVVDSYLGYGTRRILITGATGYLGGTVAPHLPKTGYPVRVMVRNPDRLKGRSWADQVEVVEGD